MGTSSRLELRSDLAAFVLVGMDVDVQISCFERLVLGVGQLRTWRHRPPVIAVFRERDDHWAVLAGGGLVNMRHRSDEAAGGHAAAHAVVGANRDRPCARRWRCNRRDLLAAAQLDLDLFSQRQPGIDAQHERRHRSEPRGPTGKLESCIHEELPFSEWTESLPGHTNTARAEAWSATCTIFSSVRPS